jgi:hypothetical protein
MDFINDFINDHPFVSWTVVIAVLSIVIITL